MSRFHLPAILTHAQAMATVEQLTNSFKASPQLLVDASALQQFDSSALAVLLAGMRQAQSLGGQMEVVGLPARARNLAQVYGLAEVLPLPPVTA